MSHFIQDNQFVIKTADEKFMLFIKGGDNNVSSARSNKRCTSWSMQGVFPNETEYKAFIEIIMLSDVSGGSWQFQSLKNKIFDNFTEYEYTVFNRFYKALKNAKTTTWKISDVTVENINSFHTDIINIFKDNNISLNNEDGYPINGVGVVWSSNYGLEKSIEEEGVDRLKDRIYTSDDTYTGTYYEFCEKYKNSKKEDLINDVHFCSAFVKLPKRWNKGVSLFNSIDDITVTSNIDFACFNILINRNKTQVKDLLDHWSGYIDQMVQKYPSSFETLSKLDNFKAKAKEVIQDNIDKGGYSHKKMQKHLDVILNANYKALRDSQTKAIKDMESKAKDNFIEAWNTIIEKCWYKQTNTMIPKLIEKLNSYYDTKTFKLEDIKELCDNDFLEILTHHQHQYKKNQKTIKTAFQELVPKYSVLFDEISIERLSEAFDIEIPKVEVCEDEVIEEVQENKKAESENTTVTTSKSGTQLSLFDFAA